ncbi:MAG: amino-acid N-acetyltransferase [Spirochaetaceae bacterium]|nr:MAG: amino-acid N-acetyltransferase [Spirochaetaceae bacterium]
MESNEIIGQVDLIREVFSYLHRFRGKTFVIHVDYGAVDDARLPSLVQDLVLLHQAGIRILLVPGARQRIDEVLTRYNIPWRRERGIRIASGDAIPFIKMAAVDVTNRFMTLLSAHHTNAVVGNWVRARGIGVVEGIDFEHAGVVERVQLDLVRSTLDQGIIPIFPCIGWSVSGKPYNISSRELALRIAVSVEADKLFFITDRMGISGADFAVPEGVELGPDKRISRLSVEEARDFLRLNGLAERELGRLGTGAAGVSLENGSVTSGYHEGERETLEFVRLAYLAAGVNVNRVHIVDGSQDGVVLVEVFSNLGVGTMIHANVYQSIRPMKSEEVPKVLTLLQPLAEAGVLIPRTSEDVLARYQDYVVHESDGRLHGCGALHEYAGGEAEIAAIAVDPAYEELGIGRRIVLYLIEMARERGLRGVFVLTTQTADWFESIGFRRVAPGKLPEEKRRRYDLDRNSVILYLKLT